MSVLLVSAFRDIGIENWIDERFKRSSNFYIDRVIEFIKNNNQPFIFFTEKRFINIINEKLNSIELNNNYLYIYDINDYYTFFEKYNYIEEKIMHSDVYKEMIAEGRRNYPEHNYYKYNLINHSKINYVKISKILKSKFEWYSWVDFGIND